MNPPELSLLSFDATSLTNRSYTLRLEDPAAERKWTRVAIAIGFPMTHQSFIAAAAVSYAAIQAKLGVPVYEVAYDSGGQMTLDEAVALRWGKENRRFHKSFADAKIS